MENNNYMNEQTNELNNQFKEFLNTKGLSAKYKLVVENLKTQTKVQHEKDLAQYNEVKEKSIENNKEFYDFLHTKGFKAKVKLVIENIKKSAQEAHNNTLEQIQKSKKVNNIESVSVETLTKDFNEYLKIKGLDQKYTVSIEKVGE